jgi:hypothetical protein
MLRGRPPTQRLHTDGALATGWWPSLTTFYDDDPVRCGSGETDFGVHWTLRGRRGSTWRLSWVALTGEVYAVAQADTGVVLLVGVEADSDRLEQQLAGWADAAHDLTWAFRRLDRALPFGLLANL